MSRKCSSCGGYGHNSRSCLVNTDGLVMPKPNSDIAPESAHQQRQQTLLGVKRSHSSGDDSEAFDSGTDASAPQGNHEQRQRKRGNPWSEEEHRSFLAGLKKLGKGDWRGISRHFVQTRTPTQVASHAQKYFIRQSNLHNRKRRSSLFDMAPEPETVPSGGPAQEAALPAFARPMPDSIFGAGMQEMSRTGQGAEEGSLRQMQGLGAHPAAVQAMMQAAAASSQRMPALAAAQMAAAAFSGRPPGQGFPPLQQGGFPMPPLFGFGGLLPPGAPPPGLTPQQLAGMSVLLQQQQHAAAVAAAMFSGGFPPLDPAALAAAMQGQFAMAASAASQMQMLQGQLNGQLGGQPKPPFGHLPPSGPPFGPPFGGAALFRPPSAGNLADQLGCGPAMREPSTQQQTQADDGERSSLGRHSYERQQRDAGNGMVSMGGREQALPAGLPSREQSGQNTEGGSAQPASRVYRPHATLARPAFSRSLSQEDAFTKKASSDFADGERRHAGIWAHDDSRACPPGGLGSEGPRPLGRTSSFRQLAQSPGAGSQEQQGETTGGGSGGSAGGSGGGGGTKGGGVFSSGTFTKERQVQSQQIKAESWLLSGERAVTLGSSLQSSLQDTQGNSLGTSTQFAGSNSREQTDIASPL